MVERSLPLAELAPLVRDLQQPIAGRFWADLLLALAGFAITFAVALQASPVVAVAAGVCASVLLLRASVFVHELSHLPASSLRSFRVVWHLLVGIPLLAPAFLYEPHRAHHAITSYGSRSDHEYVRTGWSGLAYVVGGSLLVPIGLAVRALFLVPIGLISPAVRIWTERHASTLGPIGFLDRPAASLQERRERRSWSAVCTLYAWGAIVAIAAGLVPLRAFLIFVLIVAGTLLINAARLSVSHVYANPAERSIHAQFFDSLNFPEGRWKSWWWSPLGLHLHALHHLFPAIPYHNLPRAHRRLIAHPGMEAYREVERPSLAAQLVEFIQSGARREERVEPVKAPASPA